MATLDFRVKNGLVVNTTAQILSTTDASSKDTGALIVEGGAGIEKRLYVGTDLNVVGLTNLTGAVSLTGNLAVNGGNITTTAITGTIFNANTQNLSIGQTASTISMGATTGTTSIRNSVTVGGTLNVNAGAANFNPANFSISIAPTGTGSLTLNPATAGTINNMSIGATTRNTGAFTSLTANNAVTFTQNTASSSTTTGTLVVTGGVGISGAVFAGSLQNTAVGSTTRNTGAFTTLDANAQVTFNAGTAAGNGTGTVVVSGGIYTSSGLFIAGSSTFAGFTTTSTTTLSPSNASITISPTGTGTIIINPATTGNIDNTNIGATTAATGRFSTLTTTSTTTLSPANANVLIQPTGTGTVSITPATAGTINNVSIGATTATTGRFTTVQSTVASGTAPFIVASNTVVSNLNANLLNGFNSAQAATVSTVAVRDASGDIAVRLLRPNFANQTTISGAMAFRINNTTDNFVRFCSDTAAIRTFLDVPTRTGTNSSGTWPISISGNSATVTNGVYTEGNQTINGNKTFSGTILLNGNAQSFRQNTTSTWSGDAGTGVGKLEYHSNRWYFNAGSDSNASPSWVFRRGSADIATINSSGLYSGSISGNAATATTLQTARTINGVSFNGSANITVSAQATNTATQLLSLGVGTTASATTGEIRATNNITAFFSDRRLKENIVPIENPIEKIMSITGVTFNSNDVAEGFGYTSKKRQVGVIAQEIEAVLPEIVVPAPFDIAQDNDGNEYSKSGENYKTVQYEKIVPLLIEAIKAQQREIDELKSRLA